MVGDAGETVEALLVTADIMEEARELARLRETSILEASLKLEAVEPLPLT